MCGTDHMKGADTGSEGATGTQMPGAAEGTNPVWTPIKGQAKEGKTLQSKKE